MQDPKGKAHILAHPLLPSSTIDAVRDSRSLRWDLSTREARINATYLTLGRACRNVVGSGNRAEQTNKNTPMVNQSVSTVAPGGRRGHEETKSRNLDLGFAASRISTGCPLAMPPRSCQPRLLEFTGPREASHRKHLDSSQKGPSLSAWFNSKRTASMDRMWLCLLESCHPVNLLKLKHGCTRNASWGNAGSLHFALKPRLPKPFVHLALFGPADREHPSIWVHGH